MDDSGSQGSQDSGSSSGGQGGRGAKFSRQNRGKIVTARFEDDYTVMRIRDGPRPHPQPGRPRVRPVKTVESEEMSRRYERDDCDLTPVDLQEVADALLTEMLVRCRNAHTTLVCRHEPPNFGFATPLGANDRFRWLLHTNPANVPFDFAPYARKLATVSTRRLVSAMQDSRVDLPEFIHSFMEPSEATTFEPYIEAVNIHRICGGRGGGGCSLIAAATRYHAQATAFDIDRLMTDPFIE